jgi:hypothetical protein
LRRVGVVAVMRTAARSVIQLCSRVNQSEEEPYFKMIVC